MSQIAAAQIPNHWLKGRQSQEALERTPLGKFIVLSMLVHALLIALFGAPAGGSRDGRAMWGGLNVTLLGVLREQPLPEPPPPLPLKLSPQLQIPAKVAPSPPPAPAPQAAPTTPMVVPQLIDRITAPETPALDEPPPIKVPLPTPPPVDIPQLIEPIAPLERNLSIPAPPVIQMPAPRPAAPPIVAVPIAPITPTVIPAPMEVPPIPIPAPRPAPPPVPVPVPVPVPAPRVPVEMPVIPAPIAPITPTVIPAPMEVPPMPVPAPAPIPVPAPAPAPVINTNPVTAPRDFTPAPAPPTTTDRPPTTQPAAPRTDLPTLPVEPRLETTTPSFRSRPPPAPSNDYDPTAPTLDPEALRSRANQMAREGGGQRAILPFPMPPGAEYKSKEAIALEKARKPDCKTAYKDLGLLAVVPLIANEFGEGTCKW